MKQDTGTVLYARNVSLDIARIVAISAVIMIHVSAGFVGDYELGSPEFIWGNIFDSISQLGVPLFVMVSGALLLDENKEFTIRDLFSRRLPQIVLLLIAWSAMYAAYYEIAIPVIRGGGIDLRSFVSKLIFGHFHLWYLYMLTGLYLALPFLRIIVCKQNKNLVLLYLAISALCQFSLPVIRGISLRFGIVSHLITLIEKFQLGFFQVYISYYLAGWYIVHVGVPKKLRFILYGAAILAQSVMMVYVNFTKDYSNAYAYGGILNFVYSLGVFLAINSATKKNAESSFSLFQNTVLAFMSYIFFS